MMSCFGLGVTSKHELNFEFGRLLDNKRGILDHVSCAHGMVLPCFSSSSQEPDLLRSFVFRRQDVD